MKYSEAFMEVQRTGADLVEELNKLPMNEETLKAIVLAQHHMAALNSLRGHVKETLEHVLEMGDI